MSRRVNFFFFLQTAPRGSDPGVQLRGERVRRVVPELYAADGMRLRQRHPLQVI